jgi:hypothetical protein
MAGREPEAQQGRVRLVRYDSIGVGYRCLVRGRLLVIHIVTGSITAAVASCLL